VVVELGVNDEVDHRRPAEETLATLERITRRLRKNGAAVVVVYTRLATLTATSTGKVSATSRGVSVFAWSSISTTASCRL
jgi:lysophospholipase L1-like esterase